jgi:hypothetical protein
VLYQLVTGQPPFQADDPTSIMYQHVEMTPARPSLVRPQLAGQLEDLLYWMLAKDPDDRPTAKLVADGAVAPVFVPDAPPAGVVAGPPVTRPEILPQSPKRREPSRVLLAGLAAAIIAISVTTIAILLQAHTGKAPASNDLAPHTGVSTPAKPGDTPTTPPSGGSSTDVGVGVTNPTTPQTTAPTTPATSGPTTSSPTSGGPTTPLNTPPTTPPTSGPTTSPSTAPSSAPTSATPAPTTPPPSQPNTPAPSPSANNLH